MALLSSRMAEANEEAERKLQGYRQQLIEAGQKLIMGEEKLREAAQAAAASEAALKQELEAQRSRFVDAVEG